MPQIFANNAVSILAAALAAGDTTLFVQAGHGARFPTVTGGDYAFVTLEDASGNIEIVKVTAHAAAAVSMTIQRAQQGTAARAWAIGDLVELRPTASEAAGWEAAKAEVEAARQAQASLLANLQRFISTFAAAPGDVDLGGHRIGNAADGVSPTDYVTLQQLVTAALSGSIPGQAGNARKLMGTNGLAASWSTFLGAAIHITSATVLQARQLYTMDSSGGPFTVTMPTLAANDWVWLVDVSGACAQKIVTVDRNGANIRGLPEDLLIDRAFDSCLLLGGTTSWIEL